MTLLQAFSGNDAGKVVMVWGNGLRVCEARGTVALDQDMGASMGSNEEDDSLWSKQASWDCPTIPLGLDSRTVTFTPTIQ